MLQSPREAASPRPPVKKQPTPGADIKQPERVSASPYPRPKVLMGEVAAPRGKEIAEPREAFRAFMIARHLRPSEWARAAGVPPGEILGFLTAKTRHLSRETLEKLAQAARCRVEDFFR